MARRLNTAGLVSSASTTKATEPGEATKLKLVTEDLVEGLTTEDFETSTKDETEDGEHTRSTGISSDQRDTDQAAIDGNGVGIDVAAADETTTATEANPHTDATQEPTVETTQGTSDQVIQPADIVSSGVVAIDSGSVTITEPVWDADAERRIDEKKFFEQLKELSDSIEEKKLLLEEAKEEAKLCKAEFNLATARLQAFSTKGVVYRKKPEPKKPEPVVTKPTEQPAGATTATLSLGGQSVTVAVQPTNDEPVDLTWREIPTAKVIEGIERLGKKKAELLIETYPTLGDLEDIRGEASKQFKTFKDILPNGIGQSTADQLEERMWQVMKPK